MADSRVWTPPRSDAAPPVRIVLAGVAGAVMAERDRWPLWLPVAAGVGILVYFALPYEPERWLGPASAIAFAIAVVIARGRPVAPIALAAILAASLGFAAAQAGTARYAAPMLDGRVGPAWVEGRVVGQSVLPQGVRVVLADLSIDRLAPERTPRQVRIRLLSGSEPLATGTRIGVRAILNPPSRPVLPGGFDFRRHAFFQGIGGIGFAVGHPSLLDGGGISRMLPLESGRRAIADRIRSALDGDRSAIATALLTGDRGAIRPEIHKSIREAGLAHLLAISGLHLGLVAGLIFFAVRAALALVPSLALDRPIKKWAAVAALFGAFAYMLSSDRPCRPSAPSSWSGWCWWPSWSIGSPISMRLAAWAAALVLAIAPYSLLGPSFQMSFAAVIALIAGYEALRHRLAEWRRRAGPVGMAAYTWPG